MGDDRGIVYEIVLPTLPTSSLLIIFFNTSIFHSQFERCRFQVSVDGSHEWRCFFYRFTAGFLRKQGSPFHPVVNYHHLKVKINCNLDQFKLFKSKPFSDTSQLGNDTAETCRFHQVKYCHGTSTRTGHWRSNTQLVVWEFTLSLNYVEL